MGETNDGRVGQMVEIEDIRDEDSLFHWLSEQKNKHGPAVAFRSAMRVMPVYWDIEKKAMLPQFDLLGLAICRALLTSGVFGVYSTQDNRATARAAYEAAAAYTHPVARAAAMAAYATGVGGYHARQSIRDAYSTYPRSGISALWEAVRRDCRILATGNALSQTPLWYGLGSPPTGIWDRAKEILEEKGEAWRFWINWYEDALAGSLNWPLLNQIAGAVAKEDWDAGPERAHAVIKILLDERGVIARKSPSPQAIESVQQNVAKHASAIHAQLEAMLAVLNNEMERIRGKNPDSDIAQTEKEHVLTFLTDMHCSLLSLANLIPEDGAPSEAEALESIGLFAEFKTEFERWPKENAADLVDSAARLVLVGGATGIMALAGMPILVAAGVAAVAYGGKKLADVATRAKEVAPKDTSNP